MFDFKDYQSKALYLKRTTGKTKCMLGDGCSLNLSGFLELVVVWVLKFSIPQRQMATRIKAGVL